MALASPAVQPIDFSAITAAPAPVYTQAPVSSISQIITYDSASLQASASAAVTGLASANATASIAARKRDLQERNFCFFGWGWCPTTSASSTATTACTTTSLAISTTSSKVASKTTMPITTAPATTEAASTTAVPPTTTYPTSIYTSDASCPTPYEIGTYCGFINPEDDCAPQPDGYGPKVTPDTASAFLANPVFSSLAVNAATPTGYVETFSDLQAASSANTYLGLETLRSYDVQGCSQWCDNTTLCTAFNIYIERDPSLNPTTGYCPDPSSITNYKCTLWGSGVDAASATNTGSYRDDFQVVITASNGYAKTNNTIPATPPGWDNPQQCTGGAHDHPQTCIGQHFFPGPYNPALCADYAAAQNAENSEKSQGTIWSFSWTSWWWKRNFSLSYNPLKCTFFNAYMIKKDGVGQGTYCSLFAEQYEASVATYNPGWIADVFWSIESSWTWCLSV